MKKSGGIVKLNGKHIIGDDCCTHCIPFPDPDYSKDVELMTGEPRLVMSPIVCDISDEELRKSISESISRMIRFHKSAY